jgi:hypothetical protein
MLISDNAVKAQKQLHSIDIMARRVGLNINRAKAEFMMMKNWSSSQDIRVSIGTINQVQDFKHLGSWLLNCRKDFELRKALAWEACTRLLKDKAFSRLCRIEFTIQCCKLDSNCYPAKKVRWLLHETTALCLES